MKLTISSSPILFAFLYLSNSNDVRGFLFPSSSLLSVRDISKVTTPTPSRRAPAIATVLSATTTSMTSDEMAKKIQVTGNNIEVTDSMREYLNSKLLKVVGKVEANDINRIEAHLSVVTGPKAKHVHTCEVTCFMKGNKQIIRSSEQTDYMYASIDLVSHGLFRRLRKYKERKSRKHDKNIVEADNILEDEDSMLDIDDSKLSMTTSTKGSSESTTDAAGAFEDPARFVNMSLVKTKEFDMGPISVEDACVCLDFIGHDFYVFRNSDSNEINVVYKRKEGGVGLIKPTNK
jgi:putative sigma-54 modulation protein